MPIFWGSILLISFRVFRAPNNLRGHTWPHIWNQWHKLRLINECSMIVYHQLCTGTSSHQKIFQSHETSYLYQYRTSSIVPTCTLFFSHESFHRMDAYDGSIPDMATLHRKISPRPWRRPWNSYLSSIYFWDLQTGTTRRLRFIPTSFHW